MQIHQCKGRFRKTSSKTRWRHQNWSSSVRFPHCLKLTTSKQINSARLPSKNKSWLQSDSLVPLHFAIFHFIYLKYCARHKKVRPGHANPTPAILRLPWKTTLEGPKLVQVWCVFHILTSTSASRHNCVRFFNVSTGKNVPTGVLSILTSECVSRHNGVHVFCTALLYFQKCSEPEVLLTFWLPNLLRATPACTPQRPKVPRTRSVFTTFSFKSASRHNGAQFLTFHPTRWLRTRRFSEPTCRPRSHKTMEKYIFSRLSHLFARLDLLFSETFSFLIFFVLLFSSLTLPISAASSVHFVGSLTSKFPSIRPSFSIMRPPPPSWSCTMTPLVHSDRSTPKLPRPCTFDVGGFSTHPDFQPINLDMLVEKQELKQTPELPRRCWTGGVSFSMALIRNNLVPPGWLQSGGRLCEEWPRGKTPVVVGSFLGWLAGWLAGWLVGWFRATRCTPTPAPIVFPFHGMQTKRTYHFCKQKQLTNANKSVKAWSLAWGPAPRRARLRFVSTGHRNIFVHQHVSCHQGI